MSIISVVVAVAFALFSGLQQSHAEPLQTPLPDVSTIAAVEVLGAVAPPEITAQAAIAWDPLTNTILYERDSESVRPIASVTKLMTALVVLENGYDPEHETTISADDNDPEGSRVSLVVGAVVSERDLLMASLTASANNATEALVRAIGIDEAEFVAMMNRRAVELGLLQTQFSDVTGLGAHNRSTAKELVILASVAFQYPAIREAASTLDYAVVDRRTGVAAHAHSTNRLLGSDIRILAGKTGFTESAGGCLVSLVRGIGERDVLVVVLGTQNETDRFQDFRSLADWVFAHHRWSATR